MLNKDENKELKAKYDEIAAHRPNKRMKLSPVEEVSDGSRVVTTSIKPMSKVQGKDAAAVQDKGYIQAKAAEGVQGGGSALPHFDKVQASFGQHDLSHVQAYTGSQAKQASKSIGAEAYATGSKIAFAESNPSLHTVAHEAAHIVQQQAGMQLKGGVGEAGDPYEREADAAVPTIQ